MDSITPLGVLIWICIGFFGGLGWHVAGWLIGRVLR